MRVKVPTFHFYVKKSSESRKLIRNCRFEIKNILLFHFHLTILLKKNIFLRNQTDNEEARLVSHPFFLKKKKKRKRSFK